MPTRDIVVGLNEVTMESDPLSYMQEALRLAEAAARAGEAPIGAVIVRHGDIIARARNTRESTQDATGHAEIVAIREASRVLGSWRLIDCDLFVTLEPCLMCAGRHHSGADPPRVLRRPRSEIGHGGLRV
jgi:tRNA(adenine34) deaminase